VHNVVNGCPHGRPGQVADRREVGREDEKEKQESPEPLVEVQNESGDEDREPLETKEARGKSLDHAIAPFFEAR
jgi:hypothetical protein